MKNEQPIEQIYELLEKYNFDELDIIQKEFVLTNMSREDYTGLRSTITDTKEYFNNTDLELTENSRSLFERITRYRIEMYKVAAILLLLVASVWLYVQIKPASKDSLIALSDTIYVHKYDTVIIEKINTVVKTKEKIVYKPGVTAKDNTISVSIPETTAGEIDCNKEICPADLHLLNKKYSQGNLANDSSLSQFLVTIN